MNQEQYFVRWRGKVTGPHSADVLTAQAHTGQLTKHHSLSADRVSWTPAGSLDWLFGIPNQNAIVPVSTSALPSTVPINAVQSENLPSLPSAVQGDKWLYSIDDGKEIGPVSFDVILAMAKAGQLKPSDQVLSEGSNEWTEARNADGLVFSRPSNRESFAKKNTQHSVDKARTVMNPNMQYCAACGEIMAKTAAACPHCGHSSDRNRRRVSRERDTKDDGRLDGSEKTVAILLLLFFGGLGFHRFYLGHPGTGVVFLVLWAAGFATGGITWIILGIWVILDFITILTGSLKKAVP